MALAHPSLQRGYLDNLLCSREAVQQLEYRPKQTQLDLVVRVEHWLLNPKQNEQAESHLRPNSRRSYWAVGALAE